MLGSFDKFVSPRIKRTAAAVRPAIKMADGPTKWCFWFSRTASDWWPPTHVLFQPFLADDWEFVFVEMA